MSDCVLLVPQVYHDYLERKKNTIDNFLLCFVFLYTWLPVSHVMQIMFGKYESLLVLKVVVIVN